MATFDNADQFVRPSYSPRPQNDWDPLSSNEKGDT